MAKIEIRIPDWLDRICAWPVVWYRKRKYGYPFRRIDLGEGQFTIVDPDIYYRLNCYKWIVLGNGKNYYVIRYKIIGPKKTTIVPMHREIINAPKGLLVDHKNLNTMDNRIANLRLATKSQNAQNIPKRRKNTSSQFIGVSFNKRRKKWLAYINYEGKRIWLGAFDNEIDAAKAYDAAARKYHGEFARLNFPDEVLVC